MSRPERSKALSLERWYLVRARQHEDASEPAPHPLWQAPFVLAAPALVEASLQHRILVAGRLWLRNFDLNFSNYLIISRTDVEQSFIFRRAREPGESPTSAGPLPRRLLHQGSSLLSVPIVFQEY